MQSHTPNVDRQARANLRDALVQYMTGKIQTFAFDDRNSKYISSRSTIDLSVRAISCELYSIHDDFVDHPISVTPEGWETLRRVVAFLGTDLHLQADASGGAWPFIDENQWRDCESLAAECALPNFDPIVHSRPVNHWSRKIPTKVGLTIIAALIAAAVVIVALSS
ncbi:MAG: hypothetical protein H0T51_16880 [Pirellulales bacterium]|nr:hypothetical protein [Pirellulales bacterium]